MSSQEQLQDFLGRPPEWRDFAACNQVYDIDLMLPSDGAGVVLAKQICSQCIVRETCLEDALAKPEPFGVRGGMSERERRPLRRAYVAQLALQKAQEA
jgi:WhiB family redox-sensing transcriptional regulator